MELERSFWNLLSADEIMVAETLATLLPLPLTKSKCFGLFPFSWGSKKRRSAIAVPVSWPRRTDPSPPPPKAEAASPATPLSFSPSESDDKEKSTTLPSNSARKRKREHYLKIIQDMKKDNELLSGEIKNVQCYYDRLNDFNLKLKARKLELCQGGPNHRESEATSSSGSGSARSIVNINNNSTMGPGPGPGPRSTGLPDLNLPFEMEEGEESMAVAECCEGTDNSGTDRALTTQARQDRVKICRLENPS